MPISRRLAFFLLVLVGLLSPTYANCADPDDGALTPRQQASVDRLERVAKDFANSTDPAIRALYSMPALEQRSDGTIRHQEDVRVATLLEQARGSTDPVLLDLLLLRCSTDSAPCDRLALATRWTQSDTENQVAWLMLASVRRQQGDMDGARATFLRGARASLWHDHYNDAIRRAAKILPVDLSLTERAAAMVFVFAKSAVVVPYQAMQTLGVYCKEPGATRDACARIVETMVRDADQMMALSLAAPYAIRAAVDSLTVATYQQKADAMWWATTHLVSLAPLPPDLDDMTTSPALREVNRRLEARVALGERRLLEEYLMEQHVSEAEAAKKFVASLSAAQLKRRDDIRKGH